ncbi:TonB-dependent receptor plug domain-containing protein [Bacteroides heparinolyticus]|uniref:TonB-dependent receptor plug domain-containing protein n=1 Tax=Prevotella heparinolytica TaxID=28113 RepID=UPI0035A03BAB
MGTIPLERLTVGGLLGPLAAILYITIIRMKTQSQSLEEVIVMGKSEVRKQLERPSVVTMAEMNKFEGRVLSFQDILNQSAGVKVLRQGGLGSSSRTFVQELDGKSVKIFVDGIPVGSSDEFQIKSIPVDMIKNVEISI